MYDVKQIKRLAQEEGLTDREISDILGCNRVTITRIRNRNNIPVRNKDNIKDKSFVCVNCQKEVMIKRSEVRGAFCEECLTNLQR